MESHPIPPAGDSGRGTFLGESLFLGRGLRLFMVLALEYVYYLFCGVTFIFLRNSYRKRMRRLVLGTGGAVAVLFLTVLFLTLVLGGIGCSSPNYTEPVDPRSFKAQMRELQWSMHTIADQSDAKASLEEDLRAFGPDPHWRDDLKFSVDSMFLMDDAKASLESDLRAFGDPDHKQHGLQETFEMWGF